MEKMIQIAESYGWAVDMDSDSIEFNQSSPAGEDFLLHGSDERRI